MLYSKRCKNLGGRRNRSNRRSFKLNRTKRTNMRGGRPFEDVPPTVNEIGTLCDTPDGTNTLKQLVATRNKHYIDSLTVNVKTARRMIDKFMDDGHSSPYLTNRSSNLQAIEALLIEE